MKETSNSQFGLIIAYLLPGFIGLAGLTPLSPTLAQWLRPVDHGQAGVGPTVYALLAATAAGMLFSCIRWMIIDHAHAWLFGIVPPVWDDRSLQVNLAGFSELVGAHYRYYQFYSNTLVAIVWAYGMNRWMGTSPLLGIGSDIGVVLLGVVLFAGSRDALAKYYRRSGRLVGVIAEKDIRGKDMTNGHEQAEQASAASKAQSQLKKHSKPKTVDKQQQSAKASATRK